VTGVTPLPLRKRATLSREDVLRLTACLEEHFPHPVARAVVRQAEEENLRHTEEHAEVEYVVAHGVASRVHGKRVLVGSRHYLEMDEGVDLSPAAGIVHDLTAAGRSLLYLALDGELAGLVALEDPIRPEAPAVLDALRRRGLAVIMLTGDDERTAAAVAARLGIERCRAQVMPEDKAGLVRRLQAEGRIVAMVGDGVNDSPALSSADVGISLSDGADLAREVAGVVLVGTGRTSGMPAAGPGLTGLIDSLDLARAAMQRIRTNFRVIIGLNSVFMALGLTGLLQPGASALLHNFTTIGVALNAMRSLPVAGEKERGGSVKDGDA
jgi:Cu2+-exporting ATPase